VLQSVQDLTIKEEHVTRLAYDWNVNDIILNFTLRLFRFLSASVDTGAHDLACSSFFSASNFFFNPQQAIVFGKAFAADDRPDFYLVGGSPHGQVGDRCVFGLAAAS